ncbi:MAG: efflux RND transporter periplasmic adaptor subunit [Acidobacteria bacterium]|nr:efflux RND transporter periplasmic adaptor subunit [Acidobacteriota bacterium]
MRPSVKWMLGTLFVLALIAVGIVAGIRILGPAGESVENASPGGASQQTEARYHCPMHPTMVSDKPADCPICGMRLVPIEESEPERPPAQTQPSQTQPAQPRKVMYRSTMNPAEVSESPGKDSMGMEMVPVEVEEGGVGGVAGLASVQIPLRKRQLIGVRTTAVERSPVIRKLKTVGRIIPDETRLHHIHTKVEGWIERLNVNATGEPVRKGQPLLSLYSPELLATQEEHLLALKARRDLPEGAPPDAVRRADELVGSSRRRLLLFDMTKGQIDELEESGEPQRTVVLHSPLSGIVMQRYVTHGEKIDPSMPLLDLVDLSEVWVIASIYEYELPFVKVGQKARMTLSYLPGKAFEGRVSLVYPILESATRTVQVRLEFSNPRLELKPEMYADVELQSDLGERLTVPESAVLSSGTRDVVFVERGEGYFDPREVKVGLRLPDSVEILAGLQEGESVVTSANFLVDSESKLKAALEAAGAPAGNSQTTPTQTAPGRPQTAPAHRH